MDKKIANYFIWIICAAMAMSCHLFDDKAPMDTVAVYFNENNVAVFEGGLGSVTLRVEPSDVLANNNVFYEIGNENIAMIFQADKRGCVFLGKQEGSTVLKATVNGAEAKMVISVIKQ
jgi:hypothetical protein